MRKKREVKPPSLPDLTMEVSAPSNFRSASSSISSTDERFRPSEGASTAPNWPSEEMRAVLGVSSPVLADVANILLEYGQNVFGGSFTSLLQLAQHLVSNRYVNSRSRHAFSLVAHFANPSNSRATNTSLSSAPPSTILTPAAAATTAFAEALQRSKSPLLYLSY